MQLLVQVVFASIKTLNGYQLLLITTRRNKTAQQLEVPFVTVLR